MTHFGIVSPPVQGHLNPFGALGRELIVRGHAVTCFQVEDLRDKIQSEGLGFHAIGHSDHPVGALHKSLAAVGQLKGLAALRFTVAAIAKTTHMVCRDAPAALRAAGVQALLVDQMEPAGGAVAEHLGLPFITVCNALAVNRDPVTPPPFTPWRFYDASWARLRNRVGYAVSDWFTSPIANAVAQHRAAWGLAPLRSQDDSFSKLAQICQMPREFDFPRQALPPNFSYVGPLHGARPKHVAFPWERLNGRPLIYASLGTQQGNRAQVFRSIAQACEGLNAQLVITLGGVAVPDGLHDLPGAPIVVSYAPQLDLLERAALTVTHAGLNTTMESLSYGVPMVALPITYEQPAIARRIEACGVGLSTSLGALKVNRLRALIKAVLEEPRYTQAARQMAQHIVQAGGVRRAADIIERAV